MIVTPQKFNIPLPAAKPLNKPCRQNVNFSGKRNSTFLKIGVIAACVSVFGIIASNISCNMHENNKAKNLKETLQKKLIYKGEVKAFEEFMDNYSLLETASSQKEANTYLKMLIDSANGENASPNKIFNMDKAYELVCKNLIKITTEVK